MYKWTIRPEARVQSGGTDVGENKGIGQLNRREGVTRVGESGVQQSIDGPMRALIGWP